MHPLPRCALAALIGLASSGLIASTSDHSGADEALRAFHALCESAMTTMMEGMDASSSGNVDRDFRAMMVPHHQGAIDMAVAELRFGKNEQLKRIAQEIIVDQQQEIAAMNLAVGAPLPPSAAAPTLSSRTAPKESP